MYLGEMEQPVAIIMSKSHLTILLSLITMPKDCQKICHCLLMGINHRLLSTRIFKGLIFVLTEVKLILNVVKR